jgi:hypothetical protein
MSAAWRLPSNGRNMSRPETRRRTCGAKGAKGSAWRTSSREVVQTVVEHIAARPAGKPASVVVARHRPFGEHGMARIWPDRVHQWIDGNRRTRVRCSPEQNSSPVTWRLALQAVPTLGIRPGARPPR